DEIGAAALEQRRRVDVDHHEEIACGASGVPGLALALEAHFRAIPSTGRDLDRIPLRHPLAAATATALARLLDDGAVAAAARARLREGEEPLRVGHDPATAALRARDR